MTEPNSITLSGRLTVRDVPEVAARHEADFDGPSMPDVVSLANIDSVDSSALALLLDWQARARSAGRQIRFEEPPQSLRVIARLTGVSPLLGWDDDEAHANKDPS